MPQNGLFDAQGNRLYLNEKERQAFLQTANSAERKLKCFCHVLTYTGCRLSEALELIPRRVNITEECLTFRSLKKRKNKDGSDKIIFRTVPIPPALAENLDMVYGIREIQKRAKEEDLDTRLWSWSRRHAWFLVKGVMEKAEIPDGAHKTAKGLRHGYGVAAIRAGIQLNMLQKWMGHADMKTTAIYANALGEEERQIAARMWN